MDQQRSVWEAHAEDPSKIYEDDRIKVFIKKIKNSNLPHNIKTDLQLYINNKDVVEPLRENPIKVDFNTLTERQQKLYDEEEVKRIERERLRLERLWHHEY